MAVTMILTLAVLPGATAIAIDLVDGYRAHRARQRRGRPPRMVALTPRRRRAASTR